jgi:hypothetical protein
MPAHNAAHETESVVEAADCYRKVLDFLRQHPDYADPDMAEDYAKLVARLDPPPAG